MKRLGPFRYPLYFLIAPIMLVGFCLWVLVSMPLSVVAMIAEALGDKEGAKFIENLMFTRF